MYITDMSAFYVLTGQVTYRMTYNQSPHIRVRSGIYHFVRRVPADLQQYYRSDRVSITVRTLLELESGVFKNYDTTVRLYFYGVP